MDATKKPLRIPPQFSVYAEENGLFDMYQRLLSQLIIDKPQEPIDYMIDWLTLDYSNVPQIAVIGPPASGKSSISSTLRDRIKCVHIQSEELLSDELSESSKKAAQMKENNEEISDELWIDLINERLHRKDCLRRGYILEGFPENRKQAFGLQALGVMPKHVVILDAPDQVLIERQGGKRIDPITKKVYHATFDWPQDPTIQSRLLEPKEISEEETIERLKVYNQNIDDLVNTYRNVSKKINADQPKADVLAQALTHINTQQRSVAPNTPRVILVGPTGSGKSLVATHLEEKYDIINVCCGTLLKQQIADKTKVGDAVRQLTERGEPIPSSLVTKIVVNRLTQLDASTQGWVLHGFPVSREQAENLNDMGLRPNRVYFMDIPEDCVIERLCYRLTDPISGERYHTFLNPPPNAEIKARCTQHPDDKEEAVQNRLNEYHANIEDITEFFLEMKPVHINADQDPQTVFEYAESILTKPLPRTLGEE